MADQHTASPDAESLTQYILRITYEIWEQRGIERILDYYAPDTPIYALAGLTHGAKAVVDGTRAMLDAFPDRILVGDDVVGPGDASHGYSSHRIISTMTHRGDGALGAPTGRQARILTIADCEVRDGRIVREWLFRDQASLVRQLGLDPAGVAADVRNQQSDATREWLTEQLSQLDGQGALTDSSENAHGARAAEALSALWVSGDADTAAKHYASFAALHAAGDHLLSGRDALLKHYAGLRDAFAVQQFEVEHVAESPGSQQYQTVAVRWRAAADHVGDYLGASASGRRILLAGATHWRLHGGKIVAEWTVFDGIGVLAQVLEAA